MYMNGRHAFCLTMAARAVAAAFAVAATLGVAAAHAAPPLPVARAPFARSGAAREPVKISARCVFYRP